MELAPGTRLVDEVPHGEIEIDQITLASGERTLWDTADPAFADLYVLDQH